MSTGESKRPSPEAAAMLNKRERNKLIIMSVGVVLLGGSYFFSQHQRGKEQTTELQDLPADTGPIEERIVVPEFDVLEVLEEVRDATPAGRVVLEPDALDAVFDYGRLFTARHFDSIGIRTLTPDVLAEVLADPAAHRVQPFRARGEIVAVRKRRRSESRPEEHIGTLRLDDGAYAHFVVLTLADGAAEVGDFARVDGMFLKLYSAEGASEWMDGPILLGPKTIPAFAPLEFAGELSAEILASVKDDTLEHKTDLPFEAKWHLLQYAMSDAAGALDWENAPEVSGELITDMFKDGDAYRGKPFRIDISQNLDGGVEDAGENPLRLAKITTGWIGNQNWRGQVPYLYYIAPFEKPELHERYGVAKYLVAEGFFFKNMTYTKRGGDLGRVPVFVMRSVEPYTVVPDPTPERIMWGVAIATVCTAGILFLLLKRDRRKSRALQDELVRRRRARREKLA